MKSIKSKLTILMICFLSLFLVTCGGGGGGSSSSYDISGMVIGDTPTDIQGVTLNLSGAQTASKTTNAGGNYGFNGLKPGSYTITPVKTGFAFSPTSLNITVSTANVTAGNFTATATGSTTKSYIYVDGATFYLGQPSPSGNSDTLVLSSAAPSDEGPFTEDTEITWTLTWPRTNTTVAYVALYIPEINGYFKYPVPSTELRKYTGLRTIQFHMYYTSNARPLPPNCVGSQYNNYWCYAEAPVGTTADYELSLIGSDGDIGESISGTGITWGSDAECGNGTCDGGETYATCPADCNVCGNGRCEAGETATNCPADCAFCGNGTCDSGETYLNCPADCEAPSTTTTTTSTTTTSITSSSTSSTSSSSSSTSSTATTTNTTTTTAGGGTPGAGNYSETCTAYGSSISCNCPGEYCVTIPAPTPVSNTSSFTVASGTSLATLTSEICSQVYSGLSSAGCSSSSCHVTSSSGTYASYTASCTVSSGGSCTDETVTETCTITKN